MSDITGDDDDGPVSGAGLYLTCPIRGGLRIKKHSADGLTPTEEARRIEAIQHLLGLGYPKDHILIEPVVVRLGNDGRNSMRADVAVTSIPVDQVKALAVDDRIKHCTVLVEVKRDNVTAKRAKKTQVEPLLAFGPVGCLAVYWDPVEKRVFWHDKNKDIHEGYLAALPRHGHKFGGVPRLTYQSLDDIDSLLGLFDRIEDALHIHGVPKQDRYQIVQQLVLAKLYDERSHEDRPDQPLDIQDPVVLGIYPSVARREFETLLSKVAGTYGATLHRPLPIELEASITNSALAAALTVLAPARIGHVSRSAMQDFFMRFARDIYKWDMAQYFTPTPLTEFIVELAHPRAMERVKDPAAGTADFLMAASERDYGSGKVQLFGADMSATAAQVAELNKILHDANVEIRIEDTLECIDGDFCTTRKNGVEDGKYHLLICNPPFGSRIVEKRPDVLAKFDLGHEWKLNERTGTWELTSKLRKGQEMGILFAEACVRQAYANGGRVAIIVPNGYLGNRRGIYVVFREWLLRHCEIAAVVSFPRFTFKTSGADVSASVVLMERRKQPLARSADAADYPIAVDLIERVGWLLGQKNNVLTYVVDLEDGTLLLDGNNEPQLDADFPASLARLRNSDAGDHFPWLAGAAVPGTDRGHSVPMSEILTDPLRCLDPKRYSAKARTIRAEIEKKPHFRLGDIVTFKPEMNAARIAKRLQSKTYRYVEINNVGPGQYAGVELRGWQLPSRAKHEADVGDLFVGGIWGSVQKWFLAGDDAPGLVVTNGFTRFTVNDSDKLLDVIAGLCSEAFAVQMRAMSRGSDGLAEVTEEDMAAVLLPKVSDKTARAAVQPFVDQLLSGQQSVKAAVEQMIHRKALPIPEVAPRPSHVNLV